MYKKIIKKARDKMPTYQLIVKATAETAAAHIHDFSRVVKALCMAGIHPRAVQCLGDRPLPRLVKVSEGKHYLARFFSVILIYILLDNTFTLAEHITTQTTG